MLLAVCFLIPLISDALGTNRTSYNVGVGDQQSPIDIDLTTVIPGRAPPFVWSPGYKSIPYESFLINDGSTLKLEVNSSDLFTLNGGLLQTTYEFAQLHFHWGENDTIGSEHTIMGHSYPLEMHVVYVAPNANGTDEYAVVGYFFRLSRRDNPGLKNLLDWALSAASRGNVPFKVKPFRLSELLRITPFSYYTYSGSLTTEPYTESVNWIVSATALNISRKQMDIFRQAAQIDQRLLNNFRCTQSLRGREVKYIIPY